MYSIRLFLGLYRILIWPDIRPIILPDTGYPAWPDIRLYSKYIILSKKNKKFLVFNQHFWSLFHSYFILSEKVLEKSLLIRSSHHLINSLTGYPANETGYPAGYRI